MGPERLSSTAINILDQQASSRAAAAAPADKTPRRARHIKSIL